MPRPRPTDAGFLNVPFDTAYRPLFEAMGFAVFDCDFQPRCALEASDAGHVRVQKIVGEEIHPAEHPTSNALPPRAHDYWMFDVRCSMFDVFYFPCLPPS